MRPTALCDNCASWQWSVGTILNGTLSFMLEEAPAAGCIQASKAQRRQLAAQSLAHNCRNKTFCMLFPDYADMLQQVPSIVVRPLAAQVLSVAWIVWLRTMLQLGCSFGHPVLT